MSTGIGTDVAALNREVDFGRQVEAFLLSDIGRYLTGRAETEVDEAVEEMKRVNPEDSMAIRALQHRIHVAEHISYWLAEAITTGLNAQQDLTDDQP